MPDYFVKLLHYLSKRDSVFGQQLSTKLLFFSRGEWLLIFAIFNELFIFKPFLTPRRVLFKSPKFRLKTDAHNVQSRIKYATCFGLLSHRPALITNIKRTFNQWPRGLRRGSAAESLLGSWVRVPLGGWVFVLYSVCVVM
jgi:hypothetical protein